MSQNARLKQGDKFEHTVKEGNGWKATHYVVEKVVGDNLIVAKPFKWGGHAGEITIIGESKTFTAGPKGSLPANCVKVRAR